MRISYWSSDVCSSDLSRGLPGLRRGDDPHFRPGAGPVAALGGQVERHIGHRTHVLEQGDRTAHGTSFQTTTTSPSRNWPIRSEERRVGKQGGGRCETWGVAAT